MLSHLRPGWPAAFTKAGVLAPGAASASRSCSGPGICRLTARRGTRIVTDVLQRLGVQFDPEMSGWGTVVLRRAGKEPLDKGGWPVFCTTFSRFELAGPAVNVALRGNGKDACFGWPTAPRPEELQESWLDAPDDAALTAIIEETSKVGKRSGVATFLWLG